MHWSDYWEGFLAKDPMATGRLVNIIENAETGDVDKREIMQACAKQEKKSYVIGITGPPGSGKSTMVDHLGSWFIDEGYTVGVICVDPSSPFNRGALLGDRIRLNNLSKREGYFIRSMATRGNLGGLAVATRDVVQLLEAGSYDIIIVETVGTGQTEYEIVETADTVVLVTVPGLGDQIQAAKAGIMEIGNIFVVNQSDRPGADDAVRRLEIDVDTFYQGDWKPPVLATVATSNEGISDLGNSLMERYEHLKSQGWLRTLWQDRQEDAWLKLTEQRFSQIMKEYLQASSTGNKLSEKVRKGTEDIYEASDQVLRDLIVKDYFK